MDSTIFIGILFIILVLESIGGSLFFFRRQNKKNIDYEEEDLYRNNLLCRFVLDGSGRKIGESVAVDNDVVIIKSGGQYLGVPLKHIEDNDKTLLVKGLVDFDKAEELGEKWRKESLGDQVQGEEDGFRI